MAKENTERLKAAGPIDPDTGFPLWFEDKNGVRLELGINRDRLNPDPLIPAIGDLQDPTKDLKFPNNFPDESFYFLAEAELEVDGNGRAGRARVILALEAAFGGTGEPRARLNVVFARIRVRMDNLVPGTQYKVIHPYGEIDGEPMKADEDGRVFYTQDLGIVEGDGTAVLRNGQVAPFLVGTTAVPGGYIGDGVTEQRVTGSPSPFNTNLVTIEWSPINPITNLLDPPKQVTTDLFTVQGRKAKRVGAWLDSATYAGSIGNYELTIQVRSDAGQDLRLVGTGVHFKLDSEGEFYTGLGQVADLPTDARLVNVSDRPPTSYPVTFTDRVIVESAIYDRTVETLTIEARSSDPSAVLTLPQFNNLQLTTSPQEINRTAVPAEIIVQSDKGDESRQWVEVTGTTFSEPKSIEAIVAPLTAAAFAEEEVTLDGSVSLGATSFIWTQTAGTNVTLTGASTAKVTFTPPAAGNYTFNLSVDGGGVSATVTQTITVAPKPQPDELKIDRGEYRRASRLFRIDGTLNPDRVPKLPNIVTVKFFDGKEEQAIPDINGDWSVRRELLESETDTLAPVRGVSDKIEVRSKRGKETFTLIIRN